MPRFSPIRWLAIATLCACLPLFSAACQAAAVADGASGGAEVHADVANDGTNDGQPGPGDDTSGAASVGAAHAAKVVTFAPGSGAGWGQDEMPAIVTGPPHGGGPNKGGLHVVSLGKGGQIVLELSHLATDGPGPDLIVFENPFVGWVETGRVAVSLDGQKWAEFDCACDDEKAGFPGCAGVSPVLSNPDNGVPHDDASKAGGDAFDFAEIGVSEARFIRVTDTGKNTYDGKTGGFDLDAVVALHPAK